MANQATAEMQARLKYADLLLRKGMQEEAVVQLKALVRDEPGYGKALYTLAVLLAAEGKPVEAVELLRQALKLLPDDVRVLNALGVALQQQGRDDEAARCYRRALELDPCHEEARVNLAGLLKEHAMLCAAERELVEGLRLRPESVRLLFNRGNVLQFQGRSLDAVAAYREALRLDPEHLGALQNLLFALQYSPRHGDREIFQAHLSAGRKALFRPPPPPRFADPRNCNGRRIRIGYLSPDFRDHAVARFIEPVLPHHDKQRFEIFCYANVASPDLTTRRLKGFGVQWRDIWGLSDEHAAGMIAGDGIDILIDLAGHSAGNRLPLCALRPAPLQGTWIGYPATTGLSQIDFRISDPFADPPGAADLMHSERLLRLPRCFSCYLPHADSPEVGALPLAGRGEVTFGSFNNLAKATPEVIALWGRVLLAVPNSRMLMKCRPLDDPEVCARIKREFARAGVDPARVTLQGGDRTSREHLAQYHKVDIALDTFPYNGTTTTCEALWMGVPVVTLAGTRHAARTGVSILTNCGFPGLVADGEEGYVAIARHLAQNPLKLLALRRELRPRLEASPLMDAPGFTRELEDALLSLLRR